MTGDSDSLEFVPSVDETHVYPMVRIGLVVIGGLIVLGLLSLLPGLDVVWDGVPISADAILIALGTYLVAGALVAVSRRLEALVAESLDGPERVVADAAASAKYLFVFVALLIAYRGFAPAFVPVTAEFSAEWGYHLGFMLLALLPVMLIAARLYRSLDPMAELLTREVVSSVGSRHNGDAELPTNGE